MSKHERLQQQYRDHLKAAQNIVGSSGDRELPPAQYREAQEHLEAARRLRPELLAAQTEEETKAAIREFGDSIGLDPGEKQPTPTAAQAPAKHQPPRVKALGGSDWGATMVQRHAEMFGGLKALTPSGQINVTVPLQPEVVREGTPVLSLRQLVPTVPNAAGHFAYMRQTTRTTAAAAVAPGARKPTSVYTATRVDDRVRQLAHLSEPVNRKDIADAPLLEQFLDAELRLGLEDELESQIIAGDGVEENFTGLANTSGVQTHTAPAGESPLTSARKAITKLEVMSLAPSGWVLHPNDWERIELLLDNEGVYYMGDQLPVERASRRLWGIPVAMSTAATAGTGYLADFGGSTQLHMREDVIVDWSENLYDPDALGAGVGASDFERNMIRFRAEMRAGLAVTRPAGIVKITFAA